MTPHPQITTATRSLWNYLIKATALLSPVCQLQLARTVVAGLLIATVSMPVHAQATSSDTSVGPKKAIPDEEIQRMGEYVVTAATPQPYQTGNMDLPRTSDDVQPYTIINQAAIQQSNRGDLEDFLKDQITQNATAQANTQFVAGVGGSQLGQTSQVNLRGLGTLQTLILVDGHRIAGVTRSQLGVTQFQPDINSIPFGAIDHIEVLPSSASGIYGSSAVGGVVNVVLKKNYDSGELDASYQNAFTGHGPHGSISINEGFAIGKKTHVNIIASLSAGRSLLLEDRSFVRDNFARAMTNAPALFYSNTAPFASGATPNIALYTPAVNGYVNPSNTSLTLKNGVSLNSLTTYIPPGTSPTTPADVLSSGLIANAGQYNLNLAPSVYRGFKTPLVSTPRNQSLYGSINHDLTPNLNVYANYTYNFNGINAPWVPLANSVASTVTFTVPGNAPTNPFQQNVLISMPVGTDQQGFGYYYTQTHTFTAGAIAKLPGDWQLASDWTWSESWFNEDYQLATFSSTTNYGADAVLLYKGVVNPFVDLVKYPQNIRQSYGEWKQIFPTVLTDFNVRASGTVPSPIPGGKPIRLAIGLETRSDASPGGYQKGVFPPGLPGIPVDPTKIGYGTTSQSDINYDNKQITNSAYIEAQIPIVTAKNAIPFVQSLQFQAAARIEAFDVLLNPGSTFIFPDTKPVVTIVNTPYIYSERKYQSSNPTFGAKYSPVKTLSFRASYASAFAPPTYAQLAVTRDQNTFATLPFVDPLNGATYTASRNSSTLGNTDLVPSTTKAFNLGAIWEPEGVLSGLRVDLEFFQINVSNLIINPNAQLIVSSPSLQKYVTRDPITGRVTDLIYQYVQVAKQYTDGFDFSVDYRKKTAVGTFNFHSGATIVEHLKRPPAPGGPMVEYVGFVNSGGVDKFKGNATLSWYSGRHWTVSWNTTYWGRYKQTDAPSDPEYLGASTYKPITTQILPQGANFIPSQMYHNLNVSYAFEDSKRFKHIFNGTTLSVGINDIFNTAPPYDANVTYQPFYYSPFGNVLLRNYVVKIRKEF